MLTAHSPKLTALLQELQQALQSFYGNRLINLILFGSHARQDATDDSDIDILIILQDPISPGDEILRISAIKTDLNLKYDALISVIPVSEVDYQARSTPFLRNVHREGILIDKHIVDANK
jgi:uncharacterized protein